MCSSKKCIDPSGLSRIYCSPRLPSCCVGKPDAHFTYFHHNSNSLEKLVLVRCYIRWSNHYFLQFCSMTYKGVNKISMYQNFDWKYCNVPLIAFQLWLVGFLLMKLMRLIGGCSLYDFPLSSLMIFLCISMMLDNTLKLSDGAMKMWIHLNDCTIIGIW